MAHTPVSDWSNIHNLVKRCDGTFMITIHESTIGGLGIMLIDGVNSIETQKIGIDRLFFEGLHHARLSKLDAILDVQEGLIDAGFNNLTKIKHLTSTSN